MADDLKEADIAWLRGLRDENSGHCGEGTMERTGRYAFNSRIDRLLSALKAAERPQPVPGREEIARLAFMMMEEDLSEEDARSSFNDGFWAAHKDGLIAEQSWLFADAIIALGAPDLLSRLRAAETRDQAANSYCAALEVLVQEWKARAQSAERDRDALKAERDALREGLCDDCPPWGYSTDRTRCVPCPRRAPQPTGGDHGE